MPELVNRGVKAGLLGFVEGNGKLWKTRLARAESTLDE